MKFIWTHNTGYNDIMYSTPYRPYVGAHKNIWEPIILGFQMDPVDMFLNFVKNTQEMFVFIFNLRFQKETKNDFDHSKVLLII